MYKNRDNCVGTATPKHCGEPTYAERLKEASDSVTYHQKNLDRHIKIKESLELMYADYSYNSDNLYLLIGKNTVEIDQATDNLAYVIKALHDLENQKTSDE